MIETRAGFRFDDRLFPIRALSSENQCIRGKTGGVLLLLLLLSP